MMMMESSIKSEGKSTASESGTVSDDMNHHQQQQEQPPKKKSTALNSNNDDNNITKSNDTFSLIPRKSTKKQKKKKKTEVNFGDEDFALDDLSFEEYDLADWDDIRNVCFSRTQREWLFVLAKLIGLLACFYFLLVALELISKGAQVMAGCGAGTLFSHDLNPLSSVMIGILSTVILQSSSSVTSIAIALSQTDTLSIEEVTYLIMGANVGTTITVTLVSLAHIGDAGELERAFSMASLHSIFNMFTVFILFPLECASGFLERVSAVIVEGTYGVGRGEMYEGPIKKHVSPLVARFIIPNKKIIKEVAHGGSCSDFYPIECDPGVEPSYETCSKGMISCDKDSGRCPALFRESASMAQDKCAGFLSFVLGLLLLTVATLAMIRLIQGLLFGMPVKVVHTVTDWNGYIAIILGTGFTMVTQSSSVTTSLLIPFAGAGAIRLEQSYPLVLGANLGTAFQPVLQAISLDGNEPMEIALIHLFFNLTGIMIWYPMPPLRNVVIWTSRKLGKATRNARIFPVVFVSIVYFGFPTFIVVLSSLYTSDKTGLFALAILLTISSFFFLVKLIFWFRYENGSEKFLSFLSLWNKRTAPAEEVRMIEDEPLNACD